MKKFFLIALFVITSVIFVGCNSNKTNITYMEALESEIDVEVNNFTPLPIDYDGNGDFSDCEIEVDQEGLIEINNDLITGIKPGVVNVTVTSKDDKEISVTFKVYVNKEGFKKRSLLFGLPTNGYKVGASVKLSITNLDMIGATSIDEIKFRVADESIATIDSNYNITFHKKGLTKLYAEQIACPSNNGEMELFVENQSDDKTRYGEPENTPLLLYFEDGNYTIDCSKDEQLIIDGAKRYQRYYYSTSDENILLVSDDGNLMGISEGEVEIRVISKDARNKITNNTIKVKVTGSRVRDDIIENFVNTALSQQGEMETNGDNHTRFTEWNHCYDAWCATFVSWCANQSGVPLSIMPRTISVQVFKKRFENMNRFFYKESYTPVRGDLIIFLSAGASHVGIVTGTSNGKVYTIEGNTADMVAQRDYPLDYREITGYCHPDFESGMSKVK